MSGSEFDRFADEYHAQHARSITASGEEPEYFARYKARDAQRLAGRSLPRPSVLDFGTGVGNSLPHLRAAFPACRLVGIDVSQRCLQIAHSRCGAWAELRAFDGQSIPCASDTFGLALVACVLHHVDPAEHVAKLAEIRRVLAAGGWLIVYEHNPLNPLTARAVRDCPFDVNARLIRAATLAARLRAAGLQGVRTRYRVFFPHALRALRALEPLLWWLPLGAQYCVVGRK
jgi:SAM-dependent methyltransferase